MQAKPSLKQQLKSGDVTVGSWMGLASAAIAEIMVDAGFDWLVVDLEHSTTGLKEAEDLIRTVDLKGGVPLVRVASNDPVQIKHVMDAGAHGVVVPMVGTAEDAKRAVDAVRYPPAGKRGVGLARAHRYGPGFEEYAARINDEAVVIVQIEHVDAVRNAEAILAVDGVDGSMIGPYDLSGSLGMPGRLDAPEVVAEVDRYLAASLAAGKPAGYHVVHPDHRLVAERIAQGYTFLAFGTDFLFLGNACREQMASLNAARAEAGPR